MQSVQSPTVHAHSVATPAAVATKKRWDLQSLLDYLIRYDARSPQEGGGVDIMHQEASPPDGRGAQVKRPESALNPVSCFSHLAYSLTVLHPC